MLFPCQALLLLKCKYIYINNHCQAGCLLFFFFFYCLLTCSSFGDNEVKSFKAVAKTVTPKGVLLHTRKNVGTILREADRSRVLNDTETFASSGHTRVVRLEVAGEWKTVRVCYNDSVSKDIPGNVTFGSLGDHFKSQYPGMAFGFRYVVCGIEYPVQLPSDMLLKTVNDIFELHGVIYVVDVAKENLAELVVYPVEKLTQNAKGATYHFLIGMRFADIASFLRKNSTMKDYNICEWSESEKKIGYLLNIENYIPENKDDELQYIKNATLNERKEVIVKKGF